jgi:hypothetical protein
LSPGLNFDGSPLVTALNRFMSIYLPLLWGSTPRRKIGGLAVQSKGMNQKDEPSTGINLRYEAIDRKDFT